ncbi:hypothetical protein J1614_000403 [Plenodomus biglobosus]|nr:hypothetical protein J1614_000403 [Plenodomus biglobosus]
MDSTEPVLFLGRKIFTEYVETTKRVDNINWEGPATHTRLRIQRGRTSRVALKTLLACMVRACQRENMDSMQPIYTLNNLFAACSLAQTMGLFELCKDAYRIELYLSQHHFVRPIYRIELETRWNCMTEDNNYVHAAIKAVGGRSRKMEDGSEAKKAWAGNLVALLDMHPRLKARIYDAGLN